MPNLKYLLPISLSAQTCYLQNCIAKRFSTSVNYLQLLANLAVQIRENQTSLFIMVQLKLLFLGKCFVLLLSHFSRVQLCATPQTAAHQAPLSLGFSRQEHWTGVGCHFLLQCMKVKSESEVAHSCPTLSDPMDCSLPGSSIHGVFLARVLEWGAIAFSVSTVYRRVSWKLHSISLVYSYATTTLFDYCTLVVSLEIK